MTTKSNRHVLLIALCTGICAAADAQQQQQNQPDPAFVMAVKDGKHVSVIFSMTGLAPKPAVNKVLYITREGKYIAAFRVSDLGPGIARGTVVWTEKDETVKIADIVTWKSPPKPVL